MRYTCTHYCKIESVCFILIFILILIVLLGFRGKYCEENIDDCPGHMCQNGATCVDGINNYTCQCPATYTGKFCEQDVDECSLRPSVCQNGATCTNSIGGYSCICVNGWTGPDCSVNIDDCAGAACFNGATCIDRVGSFYCRCTSGKTGKCLFSFIFSFKCFIFNFTCNVALGIKANYKNKKT